MDTAHEQLRLRPLSPDEYPAFLERSRREFAEEIAESMRVPAEAAWAKSEADFAQLLPDGLDTPGAHIYAIVDAEGGKVGELWLGLSDKAGLVEAFGYDFWVLPELRDRGIGRRAMELGAEEARRLGAARLALNVFADNERARHLYESFGFRPTSMNMALDLD